MMRGDRLGFGTDTEVARIAIGANCQLGDVRHIATYLLPSEEGPSKITLCFDEVLLSKGARTLSAPGFLDRET